MPTVYSYHKNRDSLWLAVTPKRPTGVYVKQHSESGLSHQGASVSLPILCKQSLLPQTPTYHFWHFLCFEPFAVSPATLPETWPKRTTSILLELTVGKGGRSFVSRLLENPLLRNTSIPGPFSTFPRVPKWQSDQSLPCPAVLSLFHIASPFWSLTLPRGPKVNG